MVDTEYARSKAAGGRWRRLLPCARSAQYMPFVEPERQRRNSLPFDVMPMLCKRGHAMDRRMTAPSYYKSNVRCDECWVRCDGRHFFHCRTCRFDLCPDCMPPRPVLPPPTTPPRSSLRERSKQNSHLAVDKETRPVSSPTEQDLELTRSFDEEYLCKLQPLEA